MLLHLALRCETSTPMDLDGLEGYSKGILIPKQQKTLQQIFMWIFLSVRYVGLCEGRAFLEVIAFC